MLAVASNPNALWYLTRATGVVALILLTISLAIGIVGVSRLQSVSWPRFVIINLHRNVSLLALLILLIHILTAILDPFAGIHVADALIPFVSVYRPLWLGLGAFAFDLLLAIIITSALRRHIGHRLWQLTHYLAYLCWPLALVHGVGTGSDAKQTWMLAIVSICVLTILASVSARLALGWPNHKWLRVSVITAATLSTVIFAVWLPSGPLASNWAQRAGTPAADLPKTVNNTGKPSDVVAFSSVVSGVVSQHQLSSGHVAIVLALTVTGSALNTINVTLNGTPVSGGVNMTSSVVTFGPASNPTLFRGAVTALGGTNITARVTSADGHALTLALTLTVTTDTASVHGNIIVTPIA